MRAYTREELFELAAAYALGATAPEETAAIDAALPTSPELAEEVASYREVTALIAQQDALEPPPELRDRLIERIRAEGHERDGVAGAGGVTGASPAILALTPEEGRARLRVASRESSPPPAPAVRAAGRRPPTWIVTSLAATLIIAAGLTMQNVALRRVMAGNQTQLAALEAKLEHREKTLNALLEAEKDLYVVHLKGADTVTGPGIQFFWNEKQRMGVAHAFRLKPAPEGRAYQLWVIVEGHPVSVKVFNSDPDGHALVEGLAMPVTTRGATAVLLTMEPSGGSPLPTAAPMLKGTMPTA